MTGNVIPLRPRPLSEQLEALARRPFAYNREILLDLAERFRAIEALENGSDDHLDLGETA
jgi:hypothetical protein